MTICRWCGPRCSHYFATSPITCAPFRSISTRFARVLAFAFEASLLVGQAQGTAVSKKLASWAAIIAVPTAIAGIYGMNFKSMPELQWEYGYFTVVGGILIACAGLYWWFRRAGWL